MRVVFSSVEPVYEADGRIVNERMKGSVRLSYNTFIPAVTENTTNDKKRKASIDTYEDMRQLEIKVNDWLQKTGELLELIKALANKPRQIRVDNKNC